jgi:hypothetical protein
MITADAMLMADRAAMGHNSRTCGILEFLPAARGFLRVTTKAKEKSGVDTRSVWVDVRKVGERMNQLALVGKGTTSTRSTASTMAGTLRQLVAVSTVSTP